MPPSQLERRLRRFFNIPLKGENSEFRSGLVSQYPDERKDTIQRVIAAMTVGKDVSALFPDVLKNIATHDLEQKKLVYLYLMNYAKTNPELCILATNTFVQDSEDPNPLVRALAIRTMGCIRVDKMVDYLAIPLKRTLKDDNPYVRKTAAICVAKMFDLNSKMCIEQGFLDTLMDMLNDSNQMVVANAISTLLEISKMSDSNLLKMDSKITKKLLITLNECTEWGRISILTALADYDTNDSTEVDHIIDKVTPQLQHENPAVVLSAIKVIIKQLDKISNERREHLQRRLASPLCSLLSNPPEIQFVALRNIRIILERYPEMLSNDLQVFFVKYNDPLYLKLEKIDILVRLVTTDNAALLLAELREYAMEVDIEVVNRSVNAIGQLAIKIEQVSKKAVEVLYELYMNRSTYVLEQLIIVIQNILRRYPTKYLPTVITVIADLNFDDLSTPESLSSYIWILGQYCKQIPHLEDRLQTMASQFQEMDPLVQSAALTAIVKINLTKSSPKIRQILQQILNEATTKIENADVRDKAYIYWRILSTDDEKLQKKVILKKLPILESTIEKFSAPLLRQLVDEISNLGSVYYKPGAAFVRLRSGDDGAFVDNATLQSKRLEELQQMAKSEIVNNAVKAENLLDFDESAEDRQGAQEEQEEEKIEVSASSDSAANILDELSDLFSGLSTQPAKNVSSSSASPAPHNSGNHEDLLNLF
ncbi:DEKNAAC104069 [Brettanomyces naardenensis]|uniref:AP complex subunit beta n=1 Tax=Brettanomyces naardenensis TaxID=13370 RepID=A0A448YPY1_BRENA|nr:DEKNAAC104069 [Brettanomyces naardenensis]